ncbi:MAG: UDP-glucose 6-dehydrogenase 1 [Geoglossum simile]|nr:MAG: UDP-glucose 6-dehydrogenase 1 [Geoglossum simile]
MAGAETNGYKEGLRIKKICSIGAGYVGGPTSAVIASQVPEIDVTVVDKNAARIEAWNSARLPFSEPGLLDMVLAARGTQLASSSFQKDFLQVSLEASELDTNPDLPPSRRQNLFFSTDIDQAIREADIIFVCVDTPASKSNNKYEAAPDLSRFQAVIQRIAEVATQNFIVVEKSTVPCGTAKAISEFLNASLKPGISFEVLSNPEFLAEGTAVQDLLRPDRVLIGSSLTESGQAAAAKLADVYAEWVPRDRILTMNTWSSELSKLAANALLAQRISSINALGSLCEELGADIVEVSHACGLDHRIGRHMIKASMGFGGSCFKKDLLHLVYLARCLQLNDVAAYWKSVITMNEYQTNRFVHRISRRVPNVFQDKRIAIFGFAFKADTDDTRESAAITVVRALVSEGYFVRIFDPLVPQAQIMRDIRGNQFELGELTDQRVIVCSSAYEACEGAHAVAILTEWKEFRYNPTAEMRQRDREGQTNRYPNSNSNSRSGDKVNNHSSTQVNGCSDTHVNFSDARVNGFLGSHVNGHEKSSKVNQSPVRWDQVASLMQKPKYIFDGRNIVDDCVEVFGFKVEAIGKSSARSSDLLYF